MHLAVARARYPGVEQVAEYYRRLVERIESLRGVEAVGFVNRLPLSGLNQTNPIYVEGKGEVGFSTDSRTITPAYFDAMRIPILAGRTFVATDGPDAPRVVIIDDALARQAFAGTEAVGKRIRLGSLASWMEIVGVVGHVRNDTLEADSRPQIYQPTTQRLQDRGALVIRTRGDATQVTAAVLAEIRSENPDQAVYDVRTMRNWVDRTLASRNLMTGVISLFSGAALLLAGIGLFGVLSYSASLREREFGIRLALGARPAQLQAAVVGHSAKLVFGGLVAGLALTWPTGRALQSLLFGVEASDPVTLLIVASILIAVALLASALPARRAAKTDPMTALRGD
jgi:putative ABC transport system permease protein